MSLLRLSEILFGHAVIEAFLSPSETLEARYGVMQRNAKKLFKKK